MKTQAILTVGMLFAVATGLAFATDNPASAVNDNDKETICHATNSHKNPYTVNTVSKSSVDEPSNKYLNGHGDHLGPVWYEGIADHSWGDIIPAFTYEKQTGETTDFDGRNLADGQAWLDNNCLKPGTTSPDYCDTSIVKGSVASWLSNNGNFGGADCFDYSVTQKCSELNVAITMQPQPQYASPFQAVWVEGTSVNDGYANFPATFAEDYNNGSVEVTWFTVGPEGDWLNGSAFPNYWGKVGQTITVDTDCRLPVGNGSIGKDDDKTPTKPVAKPAAAVATPAGARALAEVTAEQVVELPNTAGASAPVLLVGTAGVASLVIALAAAAKMALLARL